MESKNLYYADGNSMPEGTSPNKLVLETLGHKPEVWQQIMEDMSVVFCNDERTHTPDDMKVVLGIVLRELNEIPNDKKRDYHRIMIRCLTKYLVNNTQGLSLDQCFGMIYDMSSKYYQKL